ncbi:hypothetical protein M0813_07332 [Anaeramoeba flamelloides]|uniref:PB1 domain-containing protein n=1 Tax=Anaeramoeba flamelloides TaxID=1746091 RepID=A0ABQ8XF40_9EUKA|nr:hypothetical protein M0813_07332 [Anaeramoeba flamelloides]
MSELLIVEKNKNTTSISIKVFFNQEFRRFSVSGETTYNELCELLQQIFNIDMKENKFTLRYKDDEEEFVLFSSDLELDEALSFAKQSNPPILRLFLATANKEVEIEEEEEEEEEGDNEENFGQCNGMKYPMKGKFKKGFGMGCPMGFGMRGMGRGFGRGFGHHHNHHFGHHHGHHFGPNHEHPFGMGCPMKFGMRGMGRGFGRGFGRGRGMGRGMGRGFGMRGFFCPPLSKKEKMEFRKQRKFQKKQMRKEKMEFKKQLREQKKLFKKELKEQKNQRNLNKNNDYEAQLDTLSNLGFENRKYNLKLLNSFNGNLEETLNFLLNEQNQN